MRKGSRLTEKQAAFVAAYQGPGTGRAAATAAGYGSSVVTAARAAGEALRSPVVIAALEARAKLEKRPELVPGAKRAPKAVEEDAPAPVLAGKFAKKIGTTSERVAILMEIARDPSIAARDRIAAAREAAKITGEVGPRRAVRIVPQAPRPTEPAPVAMPSAPSVPTVEVAATVADLEMPEEDRHPHKPGRVEA